jgi:hypothetical protein
MHNVIRSLILLVATGSDRAINVRGEQAAQQGDI